MTRRLLTGNGAAAWGARLAGADYIPAFPITPQTEIIETLGRWIEKGELGARMTMLESEHSMLTAAGAAASTGVRVFTATSSQGLLYALEMLYAVAGWRVPMVLVNVSRGLGAPITLEPDHNDVLAARDSGFLQLHCATCQEVFDSLLLAYRLTEDSRVRLPVLVNLDGFYLSFTREPVCLPDPVDCEAFVGPYRHQGPTLGGAEPLNQGVAVLGGSLYSYFRYQMHLAAQGALEVYEQIAAEFHQRFGRSQPAVEAYRCEDAEVVFYMTGSFATKAKAAVDVLRDAGQAVGLLRPRLLRPFPAELLRRLIEGKKAVVVVDQNLCPGLGGILATELASALVSVGNAPLILSYIGGLGGRDISQEEFVAMVDEARQAVAKGQAPSPRLLFTRSELQQVRALQNVALGPLGRMS